MPNSSWRGLDDHGADRRPDLRRLSVRLSAQDRVPAADPPVDLATLWAEEDRSALSLYIHIPFCEMRCGFCNLFSVTGAREMAAPYLDALRRQAEAAARCLGASTRRPLRHRRRHPDRAVARAARSRVRHRRARWAPIRAAAPTSVEVSPGTVTPERLAVLKARGVDRISIGVESFVRRRGEAAWDVRSGGRRRNAPLAPSATPDFPVLNIDLIYGAEGQSAPDFLRSVDAALGWEPEELYLYPLYVRPHDRAGQDAGAWRRRAPSQWDAQRLACYRAARDRLRDAGYEQVSMRMFRKADAQGWGPVHRCQEDGMVGLGAGARSYTQGLHYSTEYAVGRAGILDILNGYLACREGQLSRACHGVRLDASERQPALRSHVAASGRRAVAVALRRAVRRIGFRLPARAGRAGARRARRRRPMTSSA